MKRISVNLTEQQIAALQHWSQKTGLKFAEILRRIVDAALKERQEQQRQ
jgi:hypothetical protein